MIQRYTSTFGIIEALRWLSQSYGSNEARGFAPLLNTLNMPDERYPLAFENLRKGLFTWFRMLYDSGKRGRVLVSAQICPVVPKLILRAGFEVGFLDIDEVWPTPTAARYLEALDDRVAAVLVSPLYGHLAPDWKPFIAALGERALVLDLAQGFGLGDITADLVRRADSIGFSFGFGKGPDTGGGLMVSKQPLPVSGLAIAPRTSCLPPAMQASILSLLSHTGLYASAIRRLPDMADTALEPFNAKTPFLASDVFYTLWSDRLQLHLAEIALARTRAAALGSNGKIAGAMIDPEVLFNTESSHLRQLIRFKHTQTRDAVVVALRDAGIDCATAGELMPGEYTETTREFPNARAFRAQSIRLPFLGRLTANQYGRLESLMENIIVKHLS